MRGVTVDETTLYELAVPSLGIFISGGIYMSRNKNMGGSRNMNTAIKPIRPTNLEFNNESDMQKFLNYATSTKKTTTPGLTRARELMKYHQPASERK